MKIPLLHMHLCSAKMRAIVVVLVAMTKLIVAAREPTRRVEVYGFSVASGPTYTGYDWSVLTASAWRTAPALVELAQQHGARVEINAGDVTSIMGSPSKCHAWVQEKLVQLVKLGVTGINSGINFDLEIPLKAGSQAAADYTQLVQLTADLLHEALPAPPTLATGPVICDAAGSSVSVDIPWSPFDIDGRNYDWLGLAKAADVLFVMAYDTQSQILGRCIANANSPVDAVSRGLRQWLALGVPASKLVLGLPWYGYDYTCEGGSDLPADTDICSIKPVPFQGVSCSDAAGIQRCYSDIMSLLHPKHAVNTTAVRWDATQQSPFFNYRAPDGSVHQVWFDNPESLALKYQLAVALNLRGIGFWNLDCLNYESKDMLVQQQTQAMWQAVRTAVAAFQQTASWAAATYDGTQQS